MAAVAATLAGHELRRQTRTVLPHLVTGFRNNRAARQVAEYTHRKAPWRVEYVAQGSGAFEVWLGGESSAWRVLGWSAPVLRLEGPGGRVREARVVEAAGRWHVHVDGAQVVLDEVPRFPVAADAAVKGGFMAPMPGKVVRVLVQAGDAVKQGQVLLVLEAMKMEQSTRSPTDGRIQAVHVREGDQVTAGQVLVTLEEPVGAGKPGG